MDVSFSLILLVIVILTILFWKSQRPRNLPPGPIVLPLLGSISLFRYRTLYEAAEIWAKSFRSDTIWLETGPLKRVVCHDIDTVKKMFGKEEATGRDNLFSHTIIANGKGLIFSEGPLWKHHRRFALSALRNFGMGKTWLDDRDTILSEVDDLCKILINLEGKPIDPRRLLSHSISNVICALVFGKRFPHDDTKFTKLASLFDNILAAQFGYSRYLTFPFLRYIPGTDFHKKSQVIRKNFADVIAFIKELVNDHRQRDKNDTDMDRDYIDAYNTEKEHQRTAQNGSNFFDDDQQLFWSVYDMFFAGTETTSTTTLRALLFMLENPEVHRKCQMEMDCHIESTRPLHFEDRVLLPYTEATIMEIQRLGSIVPVGVAHAALEDMVIDGYDIPKGSTLNANIYSIHRDERYWDEPNKFDPTRFLDAEGKVFKPEAFIPFGVGKRACLGESLAKMELFLFIASLLRRFNLRFATGETVTHNDVTLSLVRSPKPFQMIFESRQNFV